MTKSAILYIFLTIILIAFIFNSGMIGYYLFVVLFGGLGIYLIYSILKTFARRRFSLSGSKKEYVIKLTALFMGLFLVSGTFIYMYAFSVIPENNDYSDFKPNAAEKIIRSLICSLDLFMLDVDSNILDRLDEASVVKGFIIVQAALSFMCTIALLVSLIFSRLKALYLLQRKTKISEEKNHLYLFFGLNSNSRLLAKNVSKNDKNAIVILIDEANINEEENDSWDNIVRLFTHRQKTFDFADEADARVCVASKQICAVSDDEFLDSDADLFSLLGIENIKKAH